MARLRALADAPSGEVAGELRAGVIPTLGPFVLPRLHPGLVRRYPGLSLSVEEVPTVGIVEGLRNGRLDAGLIATPADVPGLIERKLFRDPFPGYLSPGHPLTSRETPGPDDLRLDDLWLLQEGHCFRAPSPSRVVRLVQGRPYLKKALVEAFAEELLGMIPEELRIEE